MEKSTSDTTTATHKPTQMFTTLEEQKGKLKIFLGYCAGVGKTYRMLQEATVNKIKNVDVLIGIVETHGRKETEELERNLETIPRKEIEYSGLKITEMDLDALIARKPQLVLVDELAHTNAPGSRHTKRYQDIEEILNAGINVFSTLNIQHVQSLTDIIFQITGIKVEETIPDRILELADEIELVDLPPERLLQRLEEGKVYIPQKAKQAMQKFFRKGNLLALRELSLKYTAKRVDVDLLSYREQKEISEVWPVESKLLVGIGSSKNAEKLLLIAHRMATDLGVEWYAVRVESPQEVKINQKDRDQLYRNMRLAEELSAKIITLTGDSIANEIVTFAKQKNVTLIIVGLSRRSRWEEFLKGSVLSGLVKKSSPINVLVVGDEGEKKPSHTKVTTPKKIFYRHYIFSILGILAVAIPCKIFSSFLSPTNILMLLFLPTVLAGVFGGVRVGVFSALVTSAIIDFLFLRPLFSLAVYDTRFIVNLVIFVTVIAVISFSSKALRWRAKNIRYKERFITSLYSFSREMMIAENLDDLLTRAVKNISDAFESDVIILLPDKFGTLNLMTKSRTELTINEKEKAVAFWVYKNGQPAGKGTNTLSSAKWYYLPLKFNENILGAICLMQIDIEKKFTQEQKRLLESFASVVALALTKLGH